MQKTCKPDVVGIIPVIVGWMQTGEMTFACPAFGAGRVSFVQRVNFFAVARCAPHQAAATGNHRATPLSKELITALAVSVGCRQAYQNLAHSDTFVLTMMPPVSQRQSRRALQHSIERAMHRIYPSL